MWVSGINLTQRREKVEGALGWECVDEMQGGQRVWECIAKMQVGLGWSQRVQDWKGVLRDGSDDLGMV